LADKSSRATVVREDSSLPFFLTVEELAERIGRNRFTVYHWLKERPDRLPRVTRLHGRIFFHDQDVRAWFEATRAGSAGGERRRVEAGKPRRGRPTKAEQTTRREATI